MKKIVPIMVVSAMCLIAPTEAFAAEKKEITEIQSSEVADSKETVKDNGVIDIVADSAILYDMKAEKIIYDLESDKIIPTASLAKVMTLYIAFEQLESGKIKLTDKVPISKNAWKATGSRMFLNVGAANVTVEDLIRGIAIVSANDGAVALAEFIGGDVDKFVKMMNNQAKKLKMENTKFLTPNGIGNSEGYDTSTAEDLLKLTKSYVKKFEKYLKYSQETEFTTPKSFSGGKNDIVQQATNGLLKSYKGTLGLKTGWVEDHFNLIGVSEREGVRLITVVMSSTNSKQRELDTKTLFDYGFSKYRVYKMGKAGEKLETLPVYKAGDVKKVDVVVKNNVEVTIHEDEKGKGSITEVVDMPEYIKGEVKKGDVIGTKTISLDGKQIAVVEYTVSEDVQKGGFLNRVKDDFYLSGQWIKNKF